MCMQRARSLYDRTVPCTYRALMTALLSCCMSESRRGQFVPESHRHSCSCGGASMQLMLVHLHMLSLLPELALMLPLQPVLLQPLQQIDAQGVGRQRDQALGAIAVVQLAHILQGMVDGYSGVENACCLQKPMRPFQHKPEWYPFCSDRMAQAGANQISQCTGPSDTRKARPYPAASVSLQQWG